MPSEFCYRTRARKLAQSFRVSRDKWKEKALIRREDCRRLKTQVAALEASRAHWREIARESKLRAAKLESQLRAAQETSELAQPEDGKKGGAPTLA